MYFVRVSVMSGKHFCKLRDEHGSTGRGHRKKISKYIENNFPVNLVQFKTIQTHVFNWVAMG